MVGGPEKAFQQNAALRRAAVFELGYSAGHPPAMQPVEENVVRLQQEKLQPPARPCGPWPCWHAHWPNKASPHTGRAAGSREKEEQLGLRSSV